MGCLLLYVHSKRDLTHPNNFPNHEPLRQADQLAYLIMGNSRSKLVALKPKAPDYYHDLDLTQNCTKSQVKKAYRQLSLIYHPDKGGSDVSFCRVSNWALPPRPPAISHTHLPSTHDPLPAHSKGGPIGIPQQVVLTT